MELYDESLTFLLPRPSWVNDVDVSFCSSCNNAFGPLKRRHHCRNCGNIYCFNCSSRSIPLPQLGYGNKPVRVCNICFDVAYLVTYSIDEDHGISTQMHGVRGLLELAEKDDEKDLHNMVAYGGVDALIWLLRTSKNISIHHLATTILAILAEKESIRPVIITKWALPPLLYLIHNYTNPETIRQNLSTKKSPVNSIYSNSLPDQFMGPPSDHSLSDLPSESIQSMVSEVIINCTHVIYQLSRAGILSQKEVISDGIFETLLFLCSFNTQQLQLEIKQLGTSPNHPFIEDDESQQLLDREIIVQSLASKSISAISSLVPFQSSIIELIQGTDSLSVLLRSTNQDVKKYIAKSIAYLSLRNDKYKPILLYGEGPSALISVIATLPQKLITKENEKSRLEDLAYYLKRDLGEINKDSHEKNYNTQYAAVSHVCCALANFATNHESQISLMSQPRLLQYICNASIVFPNHIEIQRHAARCIANLALYEENNEAMLSNDRKINRKDSYNVLPTLVEMGKTQKPDVRKQIVRAIDNLSSNLPTNSSNKSQSNHWGELFEDAYSFIQSVLESEDSDDDDVGTYKRAKSIISRDILKPKKDQASEKKPESIFKHKEESVDNVTSVYGIQSDIMDSQNNLIDINKNTRDIQNDSKSIKTDTVDSQNDTTNIQNDITDIQNDIVNIEDDTKLDIGDNLEVEEPQDVFEEDKTKEVTTDINCLVVSSAEGEVSDIEESNKKPQKTSKNHKKSKKNKRHKKKDLSV